MFIGRKAVWKYIQARWTEGTNSQQTYEFLEKDRDMLKGCKNVSKDCKVGGRYPESAEQSKPGANSYNSDPERHVIVHIGA